MNKFNIQLPSFHTLFFIIFLLVISKSLIVSHACHEDERIALLSFKSLLEDPSNRLSSWQEGTHHRNCCDWNGVRCSNDLFHVVSIDLGNTIKLDHNGATESSEISTLPALTGKISPSLFTLTHLEYLDLSFNKFTDSRISDKFSNLKNLRHLDLSNSGFTGLITNQFSNLSSLQYLDISCSFIATEGLFSTSTFPLVSSSTKWLKGLVNLNVLKLAGVNLHEAAAASSHENFAEPISFLSNLIHLDLSSCSIAIPFPIHQFRNLSHLSYLRMNFNYLNSPIPVQVANLTSLSILHLSGCQLQGSVPYLPQLKELHVSWNFDLHADLTLMFEEHQWPKLEILDISKTFVGKPIPSSISNAPLLVNLFASRCLIHESIPSSIYNLSRLQSLDLSENNISGYIPSSISNLNYLQFLDLSINNFQGHIPKSICKISSLREISLASNNITGTTPSCITKLQNLQHLDLSQNSIGGISSLISMINDLNLTSLNLNSNKITVDQNLLPWTKYQLESLELKSCNMKGYIPNFICNLTYLKNLDLSNNMLTGAIPSCIFNLQTLNNIDLSRNYFQGTLPHQLHFNIDQNTRVSLNLSNNNLHGPLPLPPQNLYTFDLSQNEFTGEISLETGKRLSGAHFVSLSGNKLLGTIPSSFCVKVTSTYSDLNYLDFSNNQLSGTIPYSVGYCISLFSLNLGRNNFTGNVPNALDQARQLRYLQLNDNSLNGSLPSFIENLENLELLNLGNNNFEGSIPGYIGSLNGLAILSLRSNKFMGLIPSEITKLNQLIILDLSNNNLSGPIPKKVGNLKMLLSRTNDTSSYGNDLAWVVEVQLQMVIKGMIIQLEHLYGYSSGIDLSCNVLEGNIPEEMGLLKGLSTLNLSHNHLSGVIPQSVGNMTGLDSLDLNSNKLSGQIPQSLISIDSLGYFNLSYNNFSGRIPRGSHFDTLSLDGSAFVGNDLLCGFPTEITCESEQEEGDKVEEDDQEDVIDKLLLYGVIFLGFGVGFWGLFLILLVRKQKWWFGYWRFVDLVATRISNATCTVFCTGFCTVENRVDRGQ